MIAHFIKIALRKLRKERLYSIINIAGLCTGLLAFLFILIYIGDELSYDRFHANYPRIYRACLKAKIKDRQFNSPIVCAPFSAGITSEFPEIETSTRIFSFVDHIVKYGENAWNEKKLAYADSTFFRVFTFPLLSGDPVTALRAPNTIVLSETTARRYFGEEEALGKMLMVGDYENPFQVTGVMADVPGNSHFHFDLLLSLASFPDAGNPSWLSNNYYTYLLLRQGASAEALGKKLRLLVEKYVGPQAEALLGFSIAEFEKRGDAYGYYLQPLGDIHLRSHLDGEFEDNGDIRYIYIFSAISIFLLLIAAINFMNLTTARFIQRSTEVGIRKTLGSPRRQLIAQFIFEALTLTILATLMAFLLAVFMMPQFNFLSGKNLNPADLFQPWFIGLFFAITLLLGLLSGSYPAVYLSSHMPVTALKGGTRHGKGAGRLRNGLVVFQFFISIALIVCTLVVYRQLEYLRNSDAGLNSEQVLNIPNAYRLRNQLQSFKDRLLSLPFVRNVAVSSSVPPDYPGDTSFREEGGTDDVNLARHWADYGYIPTLEIEMLMGRNFLPDFPSDSGAIILNETAVANLGWDMNNPESILGRTLYYFLTDQERVPCHVIGVMKDYNFLNLRQEVRPLALLLGTDGYWLSIKLDGTNMQHSVARIEQLWKEMAPGEPFEYSFMDERYNSMFRSEQRMGRLFAIFAGITIVVACLGLFGLSAYTVERKTKEIGIRKALGASSFRIVGMLSLEFSLLVALALLPAIPVAWFVMNQWLTDFANRISIGAGVFFLAGAGALLLAWCTVAAQSLRAALANPTHALRYE